MSVPLPRLTKFCAAKSYWNSLIHCKLSCIILVTWHLQQVGFGWFVLLEQSRWLSPSPPQVTQMDRILQLAHRSPSSWQLQHCMICSFDGCVCTYLRHYMFGKGVLNTSRDFLSLYKIARNSDNGFVLRRPSLWISHQVVVVLRFSILHFCTLSVGHPWTDHPRLTYIGYTAVRCPDSWGARNLACITGISTDQPF